MALNEGLFSSKSGEWETPDDLFKLIDQELGIEWDAAALQANSKCQHRYFGPDAEDDTKRDALSIGCWQTESGYRTFWLNPPYGREIGKFVAKALEQSYLGATVVCLLPARTDTQWRYDYVLQANEIRFLKGRLKFSGAGTAPFPSAIVIFRPPVEGLTRSPRVLWWDIS